MITVTQAQAEEAAEAFLQARGWELQARGEGPVWTHPDLGDNRYSLSGAIIIELPAIVEHLGRLELRLQACERTARSAFDASYPQGFGR